MRPTPAHALVLEAGDLDDATDLATPPSELDARAAELLDRARTLIPALDARIEKAQRCVRPLSTDGYPLIGRHAPGLYTAVTHSGMTLGPHLADLIMATSTRTNRPSPRTGPVNECPSRVQRMAGALWILWEQTAGTTRRDRDPTAHFGESCCRCVR